MKSVSYQQYAIVATDSAHTLTEQLNAKLYELRDKRPTVTFEGFVARILYEETETYPETLAEEYAVQGVRLTCEDCPYFVPAVNRNGTEDRRAKWGGCPISETGKTRKCSAACDELFQMINNGEVRLCINTK